jgi:hypothetical protein
MRTRVTVGRGNLQNKCARVEKNMCAGYKKSMHELEKKCTRDKMNVMLQVRKSPEYLDDRNAIADTSYVRK